VCGARKSGKPQKRRRRRSGAGMTVESGYGDIFGPQVPRTGNEGQTATFALASAAYRDNPVADIGDIGILFAPSAVQFGVLALARDSGTTSRRQSHTLMTT